jgi:hypothetical protein
VLANGPKTGSRHFRLIGDGFFANDKLFSEGRSVAEGLESVNSNAFKNWQKCPQVGVRSICAGVKRGRFIFMKYEKLTNPGEAKRSWMDAFAKHIIP